MRALTSAKVWAEVWASTHQERQARDWRGLEGYMWRRDSERNNITVDTLLAELEANRLAALNAPTPQVSAAVAATMGKAKLLGLDKQVINHVGGSGTSQTPTVIELVGGLNITALSDAAMAEILNARDAAMFSKQL